MDVTQLLAIAGYAVGFIGFAGGAVGYFAKGRGDSIISYQSNEIQLRDGTIARLEKEKAALTAERDALKTQKTELINLAQGSPQLVKVAKEIKSLTDQVAKLVKEGRGK